ncbi:MAG: DEAD/DEAH box helicase [Gemmataceae bacterium]|nr:DEAD/DEAH box helicase [Gemmataceae bacterium]
MNPEVLAQIACGKEDSEPFTSPTLKAIPLTLSLNVRLFEVLPHSGNLTVRSFPLGANFPWIRTVPELEPKLTTTEWKFPTPLEKQTVPSLLVAEGQVQTPEIPPGMEIPSTDPEKKQTRVRPLKDMLQFKERLMYLLQPPIEEIFSGREVSLPFKPFPYQIKGIAFLMPRRSALIADEMGLGKTIQVIVAIRLLFRAGILNRVLIVCPKPLVNNWSRELKIWAPDLPFEVIYGNAEERKISWQVTNTQVKLVNYEIMTRDMMEGLVGERIHDLVVLDEAQRIKTRDSKTAHAACALPRERSWAMTGTPIENRHEDLIHIFDFVDQGLIPKDTPSKFLPALTNGSIIRRTKEEVAPDMPPLIIQDVFLDLTPEQKAAYELAEKEGVIHLNELGDTITVQHVFELIMRLKQICNFDPRTGASSKTDQLLADMAEVAANGSKAIVFSQWVHPLEQLAKSLVEFNPLLYHGRIPHRFRQGILDRFKEDPSTHVLLMSYGTGSVGLNLQFTNYVFLFDRWWNPAVEDQAINRAHRLGQKSTVFVKRIISQKTIEERIAEVLETKRKLFAEIIDHGGLPPALGLSEEEVFGLFAIAPRAKKQAA